MAIGCPRPDFLFGGQVDKSCQESVGADLLVDVPGWRASISRKTRLVADALMENNFEACMMHK